MVELQKLLNLQKELDRNVLLFVKYNKKKNIDILDIIRALQHELIELENEFNWKWWENDKIIDYKKVKEEIIDLFFFLFSLCNKINIDEKEIDNLYFNKFMINRKRLMKGE